MIETPLYDALLVSHAAIPWVVLSRWLWRFRWRSEPPPDAPAKTDEDPKAGRKSKGKRGAAASPTKPAHESFRCTACGGAVPLADSAQTCGHCGVSVVPPPTIAAAYRRLVGAEGALARVEAAWRRAFFWGSPAWVVAFCVFYTLWTAALFYYFGLQHLEPNDFATVPRLQSALKFLTYPSLLFGTSVGVLAIYVALNFPRFFRSAFPKVSRKEIDALAAETIACTACGGDVRFEERRLATHCRFCAAEELRPSLEWPGGAKSVEGEARQSLVLAYESVVARREKFLMAFDIMAACQVVFLVVTLLGRIPYVGAILEAFQ